MSRISGHRSSVWINFATRILQVQRLVIYRAAEITLVATSVLVAAFRTGSLNKAISKKGFMFFTVRLPRSSLDEKFILIQLAEYILCDCLLLVRRRSSEDVESDFKPFVYLCMKFMVFIA